MYLVKTFQEPSISGDITLLLAFVDLDLLWSVGHI